MDEYFEQLAAFPNPRGSLTEPKAIVTGRYLHGARTPVSILSDHFHPVVNLFHARNTRFPAPFRPVVDQSNASKPCFFVARNHDDCWSVTRYIGKFNKAGYFIGESDRRTVGMGTIYVETVIRRCLTNWENAQNSRKQVDLPYRFQNTPRI